MALKDMKLTETEQKETVLGEPDPQEYPWGIRLHLDDDTLEKLGIDAPRVGAEVAIMAVAKVVSANTHEEEDAEGGGVKKDVSLQITKMNVEPAAGDREKRMFPSMNED